MALILHFNDVYNVESGTTEPVGGAARFCTALKSFQHENPLILFSGDIFAPSFMSTFTKGVQMLPVLKDFGVQCAVFGNHDFDFGLDHLIDLASQTTFPWLMSNVTDIETDEPLADGQVTHVLHWAGKRIGLVGLVEKEWLDTLATIDPDHVHYTDYVEKGRELANYLKKEEGCDMVIALTHMRTPNDVRLAENVPEIDLILGGHDHVYLTEKINGTYLVKSGTDFRQLSKIRVNFDAPKDVQIEAVDITTAFEEDAALKEKLEEYTSVICSQMETVLGVFHVPLDGKFASIRTRETNLGNFVCDVMVAATEADLALLNSGTFRSDQLHEVGEFKIRDLTNILPMMDPLIVILVSGEDILKALENGVSQYPKLEGRFPQVSGISFAFDPTQPPQKRVDARFVKIGDEYLDEKQYYKLATKAYLQTGRDGYDVLRNGQVLVDEENSPELTTCLQNHFKSVEMMNTKGKRSTRHRQSLVTLSRRHSLIRSVDGGESLTTSIDSSASTNLSNGPFRLRRISSVEPVSSFPHDETHSGNRPILSRQSSIEEIELTSCKLEPKVEGRIVILTEEVKHDLLMERQKWEATMTIEEVDENSSAKNSFDNSD